LPPFDPVMGEQALDTTGTARTIGAEVRGRYEIVVPDKLGITVGTEVSNNRTRSTAFEAPTPDTLIANTPSRFNLLGAYTELDGQPLSWLSFTGGVRVDVHSELQDKVSPRAALFIAKPEHYGAKLLYAEGFRNPSGFEAFFADTSRFALGVCNGCQMLAALKALIPGARHWPTLERNASEQYEARLALVEVLPSPSLFLAGMAGSRIPVAVWAAARRSG
jgi:outer membrane receptor protein involved in Fe transport